MIIQNPFSLEGMTVLVTGASSGIGRATAIACAAMGARVVITGRNAERLNSTFSSLAGENHLQISADLTSKEDIKRLAEEVPELTGVVNCAGTNRRNLLKMASESEIDAIMNVNFKSPVLLQQVLLRKKKIQKGASIVFIASRAPFAPAVGNGIYAASKGALIAYAKVLGLELAPRKIRVNCICPGMVWTELTQAEADAGIDYTLAEQNYPLKRFGQPEDVANLTCYLLSNASSWMTGSCLDITGGGEFTLK